MRTEPQPPSCPLGEVLRFQVCFWQYRRANEYHTRITRGKRLMDLGLLKIRASKWNRNGRERLGYVTS